MKGSDRDIAREHGKLAQRIEILARIAHECGAALKLQDVPLLLQEGNEMLPYELQSFIAEDERLSRHLTVRSGLILERSEEKRLQHLIDENSTPPQIAAIEAYASSYLRNGPVLTEFMGLSGSVAYGGGKADDIDLFIISRPGTLWLSVLHALVIVKALNLKLRLAGIAERFDLSFAIDAEVARSMMLNLRTAMNARESLQVKAIEGTTYYNGLLREASWMRTYFPKLYRARLLTSGPSASAEKNPGPDKTPLLLELLNAITFALLGGYVRLRWAMKMVSLRRKGMEHLLSEAKLTPRRWSFTTKRYRRLQALYELLGH